jgi:hypothetical protein
MDINMILHFIPAQIEKIIGILAALFILTTIWLLIRSLKDPAKNDSGDASAVEDALRRVLSQTTLTTRSSSLDDLAKAGNSSGSMGGSSTEKDQQIAELKSALEQAQILLSQDAGGGGASAGTGTTEADPQVLAQLNELKARLAEYEIIEDDIADLALYREENARLKAELDNLKVSASTEIATSEAGMSEALAAAVEPTLSMSEPTAEMAEPAAELVAPIEAPPVDEPAVEALIDPLDPDKLIEEMNAFESEDLMSEFQATTEEKKTE